MPDALELALANAASNMPKGEELHIENLDSIADPTQDEPQSIAHHTLLAADEIMTGWNKLHSPKKRILEEPHLYQQKMEEEYKNKVAASDAPATSNQNNLTLNSIDYKLGEITNAVMYTHKEVELTKLRLDALADMITKISTTITKAASMSDHKHRSLHEWDDQYLVNELVERENDLMPFYYELLKRIGSPELQSLVMSSMQGKNNSMVTLAQLCAAMGSMVQPQPKAYEVGLSPSAEQRMDEAFHATTTPQAYTQAQLDNLRFNGQSSEITVEEISWYEKMKRNTQPDYPSTIPPTPHTYNPYFKER